MTDYYNTEKDLAELGVDGLKTETLQQILKVARYHQILCKVKLTEHMNNMGQGGTDFTWEFRKELETATEVVDGLVKLLTKKYDDKYRKSTKRAREKMNI